MIRFLPLLCLVGAMLVASSVLSPFATAAQKADERSLKAAMIYRLASLIEWKRRAQESEPIRFCVVGDDSIAASLESIASRRKLRGRELEIDPAAAVVGGRPHCSVIYLGDVDGDTVDTVLGRTWDRVLTISDRAEFARRGGMIEIRQSGRKHLKFEINRLAFERAGLRVSYRLLELASEIHDEVQTDDE